MGKQDRKCKMISLRITAEEYDALHTLYRSYGARNVSDLARLALQQVIGNSINMDNGLAGRVYHLDKRVNALEQHVSQLLKNRREPSERPALLVRPAGTI